MTAVVEMTPTERNRAAVDAAVRRLKLVNSLDWDVSREACERLLAGLRAEQVHGASR